jgi:molybdate/tungstate transport system substrate-binding protein
MTHRSRSSGIASAVGIAAIVVAVVLIISAYEVVTVSGQTTTVTTTVTGSPSTITSINTVTTTSTSIALAPIISYSADAYSTETTALLASFSKSNGIPVAPVISGGSNADASAIAAGAPADIFVSVSLAATAPSHLGTLSSNWAIGFAEDQMVLAYSNATLANSAGSALISQGKTALKSNATSDWNAFYTALSSGSVKVGISNPVADPAGYRGWLVLEAAGYLYSGGNQQAYASPMLKGGDNVTGANAAALVAPLQSGQVQFLFIYRSAAIGDGLGYLTLDSHVNLSNSRLNQFYSNFSYTAGGTKNVASAIVLCITIPLSSANTAEALQFVQYVVKNAATLSPYGLVIPSQLLLYNSVSSPQTLPPEIQALLTQGTLVSAGPI